MSREKISKAVKFLLETKGRNYTADTIEAWCEVLIRYPEKDVLAAIKKLIVEPTEFVNVGKVIERLHGPAGQSWGKVVGIAAGGCRAWRELTDAEIATISAIGGMQAIQNADDQGLRFLFNDYQKQYPLMVARQPGYKDNLSRLWELNMVPETFKFIAKSVGFMPNVQERPEMLSVGSVLNKEQK